MDVILTKKYIPYYMELDNSSESYQNQRRQKRSKKSMDKIRLIKKGEFRELFQKQVDELKKKKEKSKREWTAEEEEEERRQIELMADNSKRQFRDSFRMCFRINVIDSMNFFQNN